MSTHLLPVGTGNGIPIKYRQIKSTGAVTSALTYEHNRMLYIGLLLDNTTFQLQKIDLLTNEITKITNIPKSSIGNYYIGGMVVDDDYVYLTNAYNGSSSYQTLYRVDLSTLEIKSFKAPKTFQCYGKIVKYDDHTLVICNNYGFMFFDTISCTWSSKTQSSDYGTLYDLSVGKNIVMSHYYNATTTIRIYRINQDTHGTITLPYNPISISCYNNGKFYIAQSNYLHIFDEETETIESTLVVPWSNPKTISYSNGILFVTQKNSNTLFIYDLDKKIYKKLILQWTVPSLSESGITQPTAFKGYFFLPYITLGIVNYAEDVKYNLGYKFDQFTFIFNAKLKDEYTFDENFVSFEDSYLTINDGFINLTPTIVDAENKIKKVHVNKSQYTKIKSISYEVSS